MGLFSIGKSKRGNQSKKSPLDIVALDEITGCLYYLQYNLKSLTIKVVGRKDDYTCKISAIDDKKELVYVTVLGRAAISATDAVELKMDIAEIRYSFKSTSKKHSTEHDICIDYPDAIRHFERRKSPRAIFRKNENIDIKIVTDLFGGYGAAARLNNIGGGGFDCTINKIIKVDSGKDISVNPLTFKPGTQLALIKFRLPGFGDVDLSGTTVHINQAGYNLNCGGTFGKLSGPGKNIIERFVSQRSYSPVPPDFLAFQRKYLEDKAHDSDKARTEKGKEKAAKKVDANKRDYSKAVEDEAAPVHHQEEKFDLARDDEIYEKAAEDAVERPEMDALSKVESLVPERKESILMVLFDADEISLVTEVIKSKGIVNHEVASNYTEALKLMTERRFDLILLDYDLDGQISAFQFIQTLKKHPTLKKLPIAIILDSIDPAKQAKIISLKVARVSLRPIKKTDISDTLVKILGD